MERVWYRQDREAVLAALRRGERPDLATTMACGPLDELVALHEELGILAALDGLAVQRKRTGVADGLLLRTLATLPFLNEASLSGAAGALFREPAILLQLGGAPAQMRAGGNRRHRHPAGRQGESLPCHPDTLRDELRRIEERSWAHLQQVGVQALYARQLVRGQVYAIDGSGLGRDLRVVALVCVSGERPTIVAWRLLTGSASGKGKEAAVAKALVEQALALGGPGCIRLLLADGLYADGPLLAWLKYAHGIDALVRLPGDRLLYQQLQQLAGLEGVAWREHRYVRTIQGHKQTRVVAASSAGELTEWDSYREAATAYGRPGGAAGRGGAGTGEHALLGGGERGAARLPPALAYRERRLPGVEGRLAPGRAALGPGRGGAARAADPGLSGLQHGPGLPQPGGGTASDTGDSAPASAAPGGVGCGTSRHLRQGVLCRAAAGRAAGGAGHPRARGFVARWGHRRGPTATLTPYLQISEPGGGF